ncbi:MAG TPA: CHAD domain-containing protein [Casimicrobiaceae bacterium]|jgi:inorganic triphosphatase YgiF
MPTEVELKLSATTAAFAAVRRHPAVAQARAGRARSTSIVSRYYDTTQDELREHGVALRLRRRGNRWLQTVKGAGEAVAGLHRRAEHEWPVTRARIEPAPLATTPWAELFAATAGRLTLVFVTDVIRTEHPLQFIDGTRAVLSFDAGTIRAGRRRAPLCEIEIELVEGDAQRLYEMAIALCTDIPLAIAHASKADQGYALARAQPPGPVRAGTVAIAPGDPTSGALAAIAADCLAQIVANAESLRAGRDGEFLHQVRVGVRRMRSMLKLMGALPLRAFASLDEELVGLSEVFGPARDWDVFASGTLADIVPHLRDPQRGAFRRLRLRAARRRRLHHEAARAEAGSQRFTCLLLALGKACSGLDLASSDPPAETFARDALARSERQLRKRGKRLRGTDAAGRHRVRIAAKKLRYAAEFFAPLFRHAGAKGYVDALAALQGTLGRLNDMAVAARLLDELVVAHPNDVGLAHAAGIVDGWTAATSAHELKRLPKSWRQFARAKPFWD